MRIVPPERESFLYKKGFSKSNSLIYKFEKISSQNQKEQVGFADNDEMSSAKYSPLKSEYSKLIESTSNSQNWSYIGEKSGYYHYRHNQGLFIIMAKSEKMPLKIEIFQFNVHQFKNIKRFQEWIREIKS